MKRFLYGFLFFFSFVAIGKSTFSPVGNRYQTESDITDAINNLNLNMQPIGFTILTSTPIPSSMKNGQLLLVNSNGAISLFACINQSTYSVSLH